MIPYQTPRGRKAFKRLRVYLGVPRELKEEQIKVVESVRETHATKKMTIKELSRYLGITVKHVE
jgi:large subunit ribosomal protein L13